jgi:hypothetical protein
MVRLALFERVTTRPTLLFSFDQIPRAAPIRSTATLPRAPPPPLDRLIPIDTARTPPPPLDPLLPSTSSCASSPSTSSCASTNRRRPAPPASTNRRRPAPPPHRHRSAQPAASPFCAVGIHKLLRPDRLPGEFANYYDGLGFPFGTESGIPWVHLCLKLYSVSLRF